LIGSQLDKGDTVPLTLPDVLLVYLRPLLTRFSSK